MATVMTRKHVLAIDLGTSSVKVALSVRFAHRGRS
jgi:hypothetical protein